MDVFSHMIGFYCLSCKKVLMIISESITWKDHIKTLDYPTPDRVYGKGFFLRRRIKIEIRRHKIFYFL